MHSSEQSPFSKYSELSRLMDTGEPVCVSFETGHEIGCKVGSKVGCKVEQEIGSEIEKCKGIEEKAEERVIDPGDKKFPEKSCFLYCELVQKARVGEEFLISGQSCSPGDYVLGLSEESPAEYYLNSGRYKDLQAAENAALSLPRLKKRFCFIRIEPLSLNKGSFDVLILFLKPEKAMRIVQASAYSKGKRAVLDTIGAASICGDCTALAYRQGMGLSFGCKGSRKHSGYEDFEVPFGLSFEEANKIEEILSKLPKTKE
ncbi:MAG TPA: protein clustered with O-phosphoseryl-tRNA(Cys) synthetase [Methanosarcina sp.]|nr:protein clustered with O-phosphoseryl-tRNA(Cys) synthetase [Methanosarcina sp.]